MYVKTGIKRTLLEESLFLCAIAENNIRNEYFYDEN